MNSLKEGVPRHTQISGWIEQQISDHVFGPDDKLPSENELARKFDVSRVTVRRALQSLESDGLIYRCQGLGSFVSDTRTPHNLVRLTDFSEDMQRAGLRPASRVLRYEIVEAPGWLAPILGIGERQRILQIDRLRLANDEPVAFDSTWLPLFYGQLIDRNKLQDRTIYKILEQEYEIRITRGTYQMSADISSPQLASALQIPENSALLRIDRTSYTAGNKVVYFQRRYYRTDRVMYEMTLERDQNDKSDSDELPLREFMPVFNRK